MGFQVRYINPASRNITRNKSLWSCAGQVSYIRRSRLILTSVCNTQALSCPAYLTALNVQHLGLQCDLFANFTSSPSVLHYPIPPPAPRLNLLRQGTSSLSVLHYLIPPPAPCQNFLRLDSSSLSVLHLRRRCMPTSMTKTQKRFWRKK